jgi:hypothetical protein
MTLKPSYLRAVAATYFWIGALYLAALVIKQVYAFPLESNEWITFVVFGGALMAAGVCVMFVPRELTYDAQGFSCRMIVQGSHAFSWDKLEAYGSGKNVFLLKYQGHQAIQISGFGFRAQDWKQFKAFLKQTYPKKKCWIWLGPKPLMWKR